jgi:hypothetical protein
VVRNILAAGDILLQRNAAEAALLAVRVFGFGFILSILWMRPAGKLRYRQKPSTVIPAQVLMEAQKSSKGLGALSTGGSSVASVNVPKWASTRELPWKSIIISMKSFSSNTVRF